MVNASELATFCDETGYLNLDGRKNYLVSKGIIRLNPSDKEVLIRPEKWSEYNSINVEIDYTLKKYKGKNIRSEIKSNDITADEIDI